MSAFVPGSGLPLSSSRVFLTGSSTPLCARPKTATEKVDTKISAINLPKIPAINLPKSFPSIPGFGKKASPPPPEKPTPAPAAPTNLSVDGRSITPVVPTKTEKGSSALSDGIPKFYNPKTSRAEFIATAKGQNATPYDIRVISEQNVAGNARVNPQGTFRNMDPYTDDLLWARPGWSSDEARVGVRVALRNVLGNANLFESEVEELAYSISCVTDTADIKEFVRAIGLSSAYRSRFFDTTSNTRFVECNFLHFLGRAPRNQAEVAEHIRIINEEGYSAEINSYVDSDEYDALFGDSRIPAPNFQGGYPCDNDMNKLAVLNGSYGSSDRIAKRAYLATGDAAGFSSYAVLRGLPEAWRGENEARAQAGPVREFSSDKFWNPQPLGLREAELKWIAKLGTWTKFWYKDSAIYQNVMKPNVSSTVEEVEEAEAILKYGSTMAKSYVGCRWAYDVAPVIEMNTPVSDEAANGRLSIAMKEISFIIPSDLQQKV